MIRKLLTYEEAKRAVEANFKAANLGEEDAVLLEAANRTLSVDVASPIDIPGFSVSRVNGYAVKAADVASATDEAPVSLKVVGCIGVGETPQATLSDGEAVEVAVGAVLPEGADAVVAAEDAERTDDELQVYAALSSGENSGMKGSDIQKGSVVLQKGQVLGSSEIGVLAALGLKQLKVQKIPMVAVFTIGEEFSELSKPLTPGKTYDLTSYCISTAVMECGAKPVYFGALPSDSVALVEVLRAALASSDMVITCGKEQVVAEAADIIAKDSTVVCGVAVKPGKNFSAAFVEGKPVLCLPSSPSAALLMYHLFARTLVQRLAGRPPSALKTVAAFAGTKMFSAKGSRNFQLVKLEFDERCRLIAQPVQASGEVSALAEADGFVVLAENEQYIDADDEVAVLLYRGLAGKA
jgi:molybdopterin biosynthesis enzyme